MFSNFQPIFIDFHRISSFLINFHRFSQILNDFQRFSTFFNVFHRLSSIFNDFHRFLGARPYRGCSSTRKRKSAKKCDTTPTEKPTGAPPEVGFQASLCPSDFRRTFCSSKSTGEGPILAEKVSAKCRTDKGTFFFAPKSHFPPTTVPILADKSAKSARAV